VPKTGGTSLEAMVERAGWRISLYSAEPQVLASLNCSPQHWHAPILSGVVDLTRIESAFMIVRDPIARFRSEYSFHVRDPQLGRAEYVDAWAETIFSLYEGNRFVLDNHLRPQAEFVLPQADIYRMESGLDAIAQDLEERLRLGLPTDALHMHDSAGGGGLRSKDVEISDKLEALLREVYAVDYEVFGFES